MLEIEGMRGAHNHVLVGIGMVTQSKQDAGVYDGRVARAVPALVERLLGLQPDPGEALPMGALLYAFGFLARVLARIFIYFELRIVSLVGLIFAKQVPARLQKVVVL